MLKTGNRIAKETKRFPIYAGMQYNFTGKIIDSKIKKVGYRIVQFTYDVDIFENGYEDYCLIDQKEVKRVMTF